MDIKTKKVESFEAKLTPEQIEEKKKVDLKKAIDLEISKVKLTPEIIENIKDYETVVFHPAIEAEPLLYKGTINSVIGQSGSRKTTFIAGLVAQTSYDKKILWIDTEQTDQDMKYIYNKLVRSEANMANIFITAFMRKNDSNISPYELCKAIVEQEKPDLIVIDNITDFDDNTILEIVAAIELTRNLSKMAKVQNSCVLAVIHVNEGNTAEAKGRGHIGSEFLRKSHVIMNVTEDTSGGSTTKSNVQFRKFRTAKHPDFTFEVDEKNMALIEGMPFNNGKPRTGNNGETMEDFEEQTIKIHQHTNRKYN